MELPACSNEAIHALLQQHDWQAVPDMHPVMAALGREGTEKSFKTSSFSTLSLLPVKRFMNRRQGITTNERERRRKAVGARDEWMEKRP